MKSHPLIVSKKNYRLWKKDHPNFIWIYEIIDDPNKDDIYLMNVIIREAV